MSLLLLIRSFAMQNVRTSKRRRRRCKNKQNMAFSLDEDKENHHNHYISFAQHKTATTANFLQQASQIFEVKLPFLGKI